MYKKRLSVGIALAASVLLAGAAQAGIIEYNDRATWLAAIGGSTGGENFNGFGMDILFDGSSVGLASGMTIGSQTSTTTGENNIIDVPPLDSLESNVNGTAHARILNGFSVIGGVLPFIMFSDSISAFGADFKDLNNFLLRSQIQIFDGMTLLATLDPVVTASDVVRFWGFAADAGETITEIRFLRVENDVFGIDDIEIRAASDVPEPGTLVLFGLGLAGLGFARRRRAA